GGGGERGRRASADVRMAGGSGYTCPMHPQVSTLGAGTCPLCGMALEPRGVEAGADDDAELRDMRRRFWIGAVLTLPVLVLGMGDEPGLPGDRWIELVLTTAVVLEAGRPIPVRGWQSLLARPPDMFTFIPPRTGPPL